MDSACRLDGDAVFDRSVPSGGTAAGTRRSLFTWRPPNVSGGRGGRAHESEHSTVACPDTSDFLTRSEPARSTRCSLPTSQLLEGVSRALSLSPLRRTPEACGAPCVVAPVSACRPVTVTTQIECLARQREGRASRRRKAGAAASRRPCDRLIARPRRPRGLRRTLSADSSTGAWRRSLREGRACKLFASRVGCDRDDEALHFVAATERRPPPRRSASSTSSALETCANTHGVNTRTRRGRVSGERSRPHQQLKKAG